MELKTSQWVVQTKEERYQFFLSLVFHQFPSALLAGSCCLLLSVCVFFFLFLVFRMDMWIWMTQGWNV